ncbi:MAG: hypothetical protein AAF206_27635 [Bacteroidota bacterium]
MHFLPQTRMQSVYFSSELQTYSFDDNHLQSGQMYHYRVRFERQDGGVDLSESVNIQFQPKQQESLLIGPLY